ncbi:TonB-dependent siderophore receptor [Marinobacterium jannaschii]|uniref:TonB-dependent siderophore receptor n=1 Tax=Marinobacterium jannaschii TaxID=64970 RepID=UPI000480E53A|nr:TonB-dependent siderophore receptor [Marinobacterium jannaschii]
MKKVVAPKRLAIAVASATASVFVMPVWADGTEETVEQNAIQVVGRAQSLYRIEASSMATRTETELEKIPQSVQVIPNELIEDQAARKITDLYQNIAGVNAFSYSGVTFRGFRQDEILYDGVKGDPFNGFAVPQLFNIDQVVVLKGPAGAMYGGADPGGLINYVTKKPEYEENRQVEVAIGNDSFFSTSLEMTGAANEQETQAYRLGIYNASEEPFRNNTDEDNTIVDLGYRFDFSDETNLVLQYTDIKQALGGARLRGVPVDDNGSFLTDINWNHNEAGDFQDLNAQVVQARLKHAFDDSLQLDLTTRYFQNEELQNYHEPRGLVDTNSDGIADFSHRQFRNQKRENEGISITANLVKELSVGDTEHVLLFGGDWYRHDYKANLRTAKQQSKDGPVPGLDLQNPVYGLTSAADYSLDTLTPTLQDTRSDRYGIYLQDQIALTEQWGLTLGARYDKFDDEDRIANSSFKDSDVTYRIGTTYNINDTFFPYALYGTGFKPQSASSQSANAGGPFEPETSDIIELGVRTHLLDNRLALNAATYRIRRRNILQADPAGDVNNDGTDDLVSIGEVESNGFELELTGDLTPNWVATASYAYNDARVKQSSEQTRNSVPDTDKFANAPQNTFGLWTRYGFPAIDSSIAMGVDYVDEQFSLSGQRVKPYSVYNLSWQTEYQDWLLQLNVKNLFDKEYASSGFLSRSGHFPGEPRRVYLSATYNF